MSHPIVLPRASLAPCPDRHVIALEELRTGRLEHALILGTAALLTAFLLWAGLTNLPEIAAAQGEVATSVAAAPVQHLEGGIVEAVLVVEGAIVEADQPLVRMNATAVRADLGQSQARAVSLRLQRDRLAALVDGGAMPTEGTAALLAPQRAALAARLLAQANRAATLNEQLAQRQSEIETLKGQVPSQNRQIAMLRKEFDIREAMAGLGLGTRISVMEIQRLLVSAEAERDRTAGQIATATNAASEAVARIAELRSTAADEARQEAAKVAQELAETEETIVRLRDRVERAVVRAPGAGTIRGLTVQRAGSVVQPGQPIAEVLPRDSALVVDVRVDPRDIGFVRLGQAAAVKVQSFDYSRFGTVPGIVERISAGSFLNDQRQPQYRVRIALAREHAGTASGMARLTAGMTVQADIATGTKTVLEYLLKPIYASTATAFRER